ncbi:EAL domain-containing protein, partial [Salmonella sp. C3276]|uniref:EAL domain-containing protein n=1 Tax=unclassified Salmonella TaxID=2614656 RepID=UPI003F47C94F
AGGISATQSFGRDLKKCLELKRVYLQDSLDAMIVKSITDLAKAKSLSVVAEFVETPAQRDLLLQLGVHSLQGYLIGRPRPLGK